MHDHDFEQNLARRLRRYEASIPDPAAFAVGSRRPAAGLLRWLVVGVAGAGLVTGLLLAALLLRPPDSNVGDATPSPASASVEASPSASGTSAPTSSPPVSTPTLTAGPTAAPILARAAEFPGTQAGAFTAWPGGWIAAGQNADQPAIWLSPDGATWDAVEPSGLDGGAVSHLVAMPDGRVLAFGFFDDGSLGGEAAAWISADGRTWERFDLGIPNLRNPVDVASGPLGMVLIGRAETNAAGRNEYAWFSGDGVTWERVWDTTADHLPAAVGAGPEGFVIVGQQAYEFGDPIGFALASADGHEWVEAPESDVLQLAGPMWSVAPFGGDWIATSMQISDVHVMRSANGLEWTFDESFPDEEARHGAVAQLAGDSRFAFLGSISVEPTVLPVMLLTEGEGWHETPASTAGQIAAASLDGVTVLMVNAGDPVAPTVEFWISATPD